MSRKPERARSHRAAVLVPLLERDGRDGLLFEARAAGLREQPGEVCFPGGAAEPGETPEACALREAAEEIGLSRADVAVLGHLSEQTHISGRTVTPVVGRVRCGAELSAAGAEVAELFWVPLEFFRTQPSRRCYYWLTAACGPAVPAEIAQSLARYRYRRETEYWLWQGRAIWGMTARILLDLLADPADG